MEVVLKCTLCLTIVYSSRPPHAIIQRVPYPARQIRPSRVHEVAVKDDDIAGLGEDGLTFA